MVVKHNPICTCPPQYTGDPFVRCLPFSKFCYINKLKKDKSVKVNEIKFYLSTGPVIADTTPCVPSPCGPNAICKEVLGSPSCACLPNFFGSPPYCRPECSSNSECPINQACINQKCKDPCINICGQNANCRVISHSPMCFCDFGYEGDPFSHCQLQKQPIPEKTSPCEPSPCGANAICKEHNSAGSCICLPDYIGNPYEGCRPECTVNTDCAPNRSCIRNKCQDPCPGTCGPMAICETINHSPVCSCSPGYTGEPYYRCDIVKGIYLSKHSTKLFSYDLVTIFFYYILESSPEPTPCVPNPCGPNSVCQSHNGQSACSCMPNYVGSPPGCRPECTISSECPSNKACINLKCVDPCPSHCGINSECRVLSHSPICSCMSGYTGDPFTRCYSQRE